MEISIKVDTKILQTQAETVRKLARELRDVMTETRTTVKGTAQYWKGDAADVQRREVQDSYNNYEEMFKRIDEMAVMLEKLAGVYEESDKGAAGEVETLPTVIN